MANEEQLEVLRHGAYAWYLWRERNRHRVIDLREADLSETYLNGVDLRGADLSQAILDNANLRAAYLADANLYGASLDTTNLSESNLCGANLKNATVGGTIFGNIDLSKAIGLEKVRHHRPSTLGTDTLQKSKGEIPIAFLRGCGLSNLDIEYAKLANPDLGNEEINKILYKIYDLRARNAIQISPLFISYSHGDSQFVDKMEESLNRKGIRFWRDIHDMRSGRMEKQIDRAMRLNPTVLLILSEHSLQSDWVEHEVRTARALEKELKEDVLCPVALDDSWKNGPWAKRIMEQVMDYNILDFSEWKDDTKFESTFNKLIDGLELFYK